ncbi:hypothetical protein [Corynebacterium aurimucosum]|nr:hypothetical protein [Corynebacterium aurimucosum]
MSQQRKKYTPEYRREAANLVHSEWSAPSTSRTTPAQSTAEKK